MSRRPPRSLRQGLPLAITALLIAGCGRSPHSESDVVAAFAAQGVELQRARFQPRRISDSERLALGEVRSELVRARSGDTEFRVSVRVYSSAAAATGQVGSPIVERARWQAQGCELITRFNVAALVCRARRLELERVRAAMATLD